MDDKKKLIELLIDGHGKYLYYDQIANHLIANGVTFAKDTNVPSKTDAIMEEMYDFYQKTVAHAGPSKVDYIDGVYAIMDHMARWFEQKEGE